ncbi:hypothetical protein SAMN05421813_14112 [Daejeonella rubra]|uniref:Uncharacterized protein n=1 Tax=Daejeonella rubra TaxID=990371 RepID=A0A1G9YL47_9SPHI|nr:hypothetical protein [Daejeonella rubra]SDN09969.1 hypothetical protein SAMN05421813_14112 [Daejeonella rubra]
MNIKNLELDLSSDFNEKLTKELLILQNLINALNKKEIPPSISDKINQEIEKLNSASIYEDHLIKKIKSNRGFILKLLEKELNFVPAHHFRNLWMALGLSAFGIPIGVAIGIASKNLGLLGLGFAPGILIGLAIGNRKDKTAFKKGLQLDFEVK